VSQTVVLTGLGSDRVGIVAELSEALVNLGCSVLDSSATILRGQFALILMATLPERISLEMLHDSLSTVEENLGYKLDVRVLPKEEHETLETVNADYVISVYGDDSRGIFCGITRKLAELGVNITDVQTKRTSREHRIFMMVLKVSVPAKLNLEKLTKEMKTTAADLSVDLFVREIQDFEM
jgi:glycine cleavage system transcriptional repressor